MAFILYPLENYDSMCSILDADDIISKNVPTAQRAKWDAITEDSDKEIQLRIATMKVKQTIKSFPATLEIELKQATALTANYSIGKDMSKNDNKDNIKRKRIEGEIDTEYFTKADDKSNDLSDTVIGLLNKYNVTSSNSFKFKRS